MRRCIAGVLLALGACGVPVRDGAVEVRGDEGSPTAVAARVEADPAARAEVVPVAAEAVVDRWRATLTRDPLAVRYTPQPGLVPPEASAALFWPAGGPVRFTLREIEALAGAAPGDESARQGQVAVVVSRDGIGVAEKEVLRFADGRIPAGALAGPVIPALVEALRTAGDEMVVVADRGVRHADLGAVLASGARAGIWRRSIAVRDPADPAGTASGSFDVWGPWFTPGAPAEAVAPSIAVLDLDARELVLYMRITDEAVELGELLHSGAFRGLGRVRRDEGWEPVRQIALAAALREPSEIAGIVVFGAEDDVPVERVVAALAAVTGVRCGSHRGVCHFSDKLLVAGEMSLHAMGAGLGALTVAEGEQRSWHPSSHCAGSVARGVKRVWLGRTMNDDIEAVTGVWLEIVKDGEGETTVRVMPPWRETSWNREGPDRAIVLTKGSGCARYEVALGRDTGASDLAFGAVDLDCTVGAATVRGRVRFAGCLVLDE